MDTKTMQINTFAKGMDTDISDSLLNSESYRLAKNLRIVTDTEENSGELRLIEGAKLIDPTTDYDNYSDSQVLAATEIRNYGIIITKEPISSIPGHGDDQDDDNVTFDYIVKWTSTQIQDIDASDVNHEYFLTNVTFDTEYRLSDDPNDSEHRGYYKYTHLPVVDITYVLNDGNGTTKTITHDLKDNDTAYISEDWPIVSIEVEINQDFLNEKPIDVISYTVDPIGMQTQNVILIDGEIVDANDDIPESGLDKNARTVIWFIENHYNEDEVFKSSSFCSAVFVGTPNQVRMDNIKEEWRTKQLAVYAGDILYIQYSNRSYTSSIETKQLSLYTPQAKRLTNSQSLSMNGPVYSYEQPQYPKNVVLTQNANNGARPLPGGQTPNPLEEATWDNTQLAYYWEAPPNQSHPDNSIKYYLLDQGVINTYGRETFVSTIEPLNPDTGRRGSRRRAPNINPGTRLQYSWSVWRFNNDSDELDKVLTCYTPIGDNFKNKLSLVTEWEDEDNIKLYIADGEHEVMVLNVAKDNGEYIGLKKLIGKSTKHVPQIQNIQQISGSLLPSYVQYTYRLYNKHEVATKLAPVSKLHIVSAGSKGIRQGAASNVGFKLDIPYLFNDFEYIEIYRITYQQLGQLPSVELIIDTKYQHGDVYNDVGQPALQSLSVEEFNGLDGIDIVPRMIESKDGFLFASNIQKYGTSEYINTVESWDSTAMSSNMKSNLDLSISFDINIWEFGYDNSGSNINWEYITNSVILSDSTDSYQEPSSLYQNDQRSLRRGEIYRYGIILYMDDGYISQPKWIADIRTPEPSYSVKQRIQEYNGGNQPDTTAAKKLYRIANFVTDEENKLIANNLGIRFTVNNLPEGCIGYEIVRCERTIADRSTITQVALSNTYVYRSDEDFREHKVSGEVVMPTGLVTTSAIQYYAIDGDFLNKNHPDHNFATGSDYIWFDEAEEDEFYGDKHAHTGIIENHPGIYQAISPEIIYQPDDVRNIFNTYDQLQIKPVLRLFPYTEKEPIDSEVAHQNATLVRPGSSGMWYINPYGNVTDDNSRVVIYSGPNITANDNIDQQNRYGAWNLVLSTAYFNKNGFNNQNGSGDSGGNSHADVRRLNTTALFKMDDFIHANELNIWSTTQDPNPADIKDYGFASVPLWNQFADNEGGLQFTDNPVVVDGKEYLNWVFPAYLLDYDTSRVQKESYIKEHLKNYSSSIPRQSRIDIGGRCAIIAADIPLLEQDYYDSNSQYHLPQIFSTYLCNIKKHCVPYNGVNTAEDSVYYSHGSYSNSETTIDVYDGDTYIRCLEYSASHDWENPYYRYHIGQTNIYYIPFETDINIPYDHGDRYSRVQNRYIQDQPSSVNGKYVQKNPEYQYNTAYHASSVIQPHASSRDYYEDVKDVYDYRTHYSNHKSSNEKLDSFTVFQPLNYLDVDTRYGEITDLRKFQNKLIYWQKNAVGLFSVNERSQITDDSNLPLILGTGGVLARYDYLSTRNGMRENQFADTQSDTALYWWDYDRHEICAYNDGLIVTPLSKLKHIQNLLNLDTSHGVLLNSPKLTYDKQYDEILFTVSNIYSIIYNEQLQQFTAVYEVSPFESLEFTNRLILLPTWLLLYHWNHDIENGAYGIEGNELRPYLKYVINENAAFTKVYDNTEFAGRFYGADGHYTEDNYSLACLAFAFKTPLKQEGKCSGLDITNRQYDFKYAIPRAGKFKEFQLPHHPTIIRWVTSAYGDRLRGKTMQCEMSSYSNSLDFSLQYIMTKYRISWS